MALLAALATAVPFVLAVSGGPASASLLTSPAQRAAVRAGHLPRVGRLAVTRRALPDAVVHQAYSFRFQVRGTGARVSWAAVGALPAGLSLDARTGTLSGTPATAGSSAVLVSAATSGHHRAVGYADAVLTVERPVITQVAVQRAGGAAGAGPVLRIWGSGFGVPPPLDQGKRPGCTAQAGAHGGLAGLLVRDMSRPGSYGNGPGCERLVIASWTDHQIVASLAPGRGHGGGPGIVAGDRLAVRAGGARWAGTATVVPAGGRVVLAVPARALRASAGVPYQVTLAAAGGALPVSWRVTSGRLPAGLVLDRSTGVISGTPRAAGTRVVSVQAAGPGARPAQARITLAVSDQVTVPEPTVASSLYQGLYFGQLGSAPELENLLLADVAAGTYAAHPAAVPATVQSELAALKTAFDTATNPVVSGTGTGLVSFGPNTVAQLTGALSVMISFATANQADLISSAALTAARSIYTQYLQSNLANAIGYGQGYAGFDDRSVYDTGDVAGSAFHALVSAPIVAQAASCGQASAACATVVDSLLQTVTGVSSAATPAQMVSADPALGTMLTTLGLTLNSDGTVTTSAASYDTALGTVSTQVGGTTGTGGTVGTESTDMASLIAMAGDPAAPSDPSATAAASASDVSATLPDVDTELTEASFLKAIGNAVDPANANASSNTLLGGVSIAQGVNQVLKALGSDDATQDTEISDTIGAFIDVCTGNFADAIKNVFGLLSATSGSGNNEAYQLAQQTDQMIQNVYNNLSAQLKQVESGLQQVQTTLRNLYSTMIADFQYVDFALDEVSSQLAAAIVGLNQLQYSVDITDQNLLNITSAEVNGTIQGHFNACLDYASRFPGQPGLTASAYETCEGDFKTDATSVGVAANPGVEYQIPGPYDNLHIATNLQPGYDLSANLLYLLTILNNRWPADAPAPPANLVNPDVWAEAALGYRELLDENLNYSAGLEPDTAAVQLPGQQVVAAVSALQKVNSSGQSPVINDVAGNYSSALTQLDNDLNSHQSLSDFTTNNPSWDGYNATAGPEQSRPAQAPDPAQQVSGLAACGGGTATAVTLPSASSWEGGMNVPNSWYLVSDIGRQVQAGYAMTSAPLCITYSEKETGVHCNPKTGICTGIYTESGSITFQYLGLDGSLHPIETLSTATVTADCAVGTPLNQCGIDANDYFNGLINSAGGLQQFLTNIGGKSGTTDTSVLDADANTILAAEQQAVYNWGIDGFTNTKDPDYTTLNGDVNSLAGAFELLQATAQLVAPSASRGNQAISDILYGNDQLPSSISAPNNPVALFEALLNGSSTTLADWESTQSSRLTELQTLLNGYLNSVTAAGNLTTAEVPALVLSTLAQLNTGLQLGLNQPPAIKTPSKVTYSTGQTVKLTINSSGYPVPALTLTGKLPAGLKATKASGKLTITGTVSTAATLGTYKITITATNRAGKATKKITITIKA